MHIYIYISIYIYIYTVAIIIACVPHVDFTLFGANTSLLNILFCIKISKSYNIWWAMINMTLLSWLQQNSCVSWIWYSICLFSFIIPTQ